MPPDPYLARPGAPLPLTHTPPTAEILPSAQLPGAPTPSANQYSVGKKPDSSFQGIIYI